MDTQGIKKGVKTGLSADDKKTVVIPGTVDLIERDF